MVKCSFMNEVADSPCCHLEPKTVNIMDEEKKLKMEELILNKLSFKKKTNISLGPFVLYQRLFRRTNFHRYQCLKLETQIFIL